MIKRFLILLLFLSVPAALNAQRLIDGQPFASIQGGTVFPSSFNPYIPQGHLGYGGCTHYGKWVVGASVGYAGMKYSGEIESNGVSIPYSLSTGNIDLSADGAYLVRIVSNRSRSVSFWGGIGAAVGARIYGSPDPSFFSNENGKKFYVPGARFLYGFYPRFDLEVFVSKSLSLDLYTRLNFMMRVSGRNDTWFKDGSFFFPETGLALNFYFFYE